MHPELLASAIDSLTGAQWTRAESEVQVPRAPGLYALSGDGRAWADLCLQPAFEEQPLYFGKAEKNLNGRDVGTHFAVGKTGSSTVRRSLAALLVERLDLSAVPRNLSKPDGSANFSVETAGDQRLSAWMDARLRLSIWLRQGDARLDDVETAVLRQLRPPLNLDKVGESRVGLRQARARMAAAARSYHA